MASGLATAAATKVVLHNGLCPGDVLVMSAAIESLARSYPGRFEIAVSSNHNELFLHNPHVRGHRDGVQITAHYPGINRSNQEPISFLQAYTDYIGDQLGLRLPTLCKPFLYLSDEERSPDYPKRFGLPINFALVNAGRKGDYPTKWPGTQIFQETVDAYRGKVQFVQVGHSGDHHPPLRSAINLVGKTSVRDVAVLAYHALFGVGGVTFLHWAFAAHSRPYVCLLGGREPLSWVYTPSAAILSVTGQLPCCAWGGCWKNKVTKIDGDESICERPVPHGPDTIPECMRLIGSEGVLKALDVLFSSGRVVRKPEPLSTLPKLWEGKPRLGVVVGTYAAVPYVHLHLEAWKRYYPEVPLLVVDDGSPRSTDLADLCSRYGADFVCNETQYGHAKGDISVFSHGLYWASRIGVDLLVKFSRRWLPVHDWRPALVDLAERSQYATFSAVCNYHRFGFRSECQGMHVPSWLRHVGTLRNAIRGGEVGLAEALYHNISGALHAEKCAAAVDYEATLPDRLSFATWEAMGDSRMTRQRGFLWHDCFSPSEYWVLSHEWGLPYRPVDFFDPNK